MHARAQVKERSKPGARRGEGLGRTHLAPLPPTRLHARHEVGIGVGRAEGDGVVGVRDGMDLEGEGQELKKSSQGGEGTGAASKSKRSQQEPCERSEELRVTPPRLLDELQVGERRPPVHHLVQDAP